MLNSFKISKLFGLDFSSGIKPVFYIVFLFFTLYVKAQENLVPNGDFEEYITCPSNNFPYYFVDRATQWFMPTTGSADYFNAYSSDLTANGILAFSVPQNYEGYQDAHSGQGYAGYYAGLVPANNNYHEYLSVKLNKPLEKEKWYYLSYYLSLADSTFLNGDPQQFVNYSGAYFSPKMEFIDNYFRIEVEAQFRSNPEVFLDDSLGWQKVDGYFLASGGEEFLTIGYFCKYQDVLFNYASSSDSGVLAYYYIDDVQLIETNVQFPNVFTPNFDGTNDIAFKFENVSEMDVEIFNRWGNEVLKTTTLVGWNGNDKTGHELSEGTYYYIVKYKGKKQKTGFIHLVR